MLLGFSSTVLHVEQSLGGAQNHVFRASFFSLHNMCTIVDILRLKARAMNYSSIILCTYQHEGITEYYGVFGNIHRNWWHNWQTSSCMWSTDSKFIYWQHMQLNVQMKSVHFAIVVYSSESDNVVYSSESDNVTNLTFCLLPSPGWESLSASSPLYTWCVCVSVGGRRWVCMVRGCVVWMRVWVGEISIYLLFCCKLF